MQFKEAFEGRLLALSKTHNLLTRKSWREADLREIVEQELAPYRKSGDSESRIEGPKVNLPARYAINFGLVPHELVTNAAKYGALSMPSGHLDVSWSVIPGEDPPPQLRFHWAESGGPPVSPPEAPGLRLTPDQAQHRRRAGRHTWCSTSPSRACPMTSPVRLDGRSPPHRSDASISSARKVFPGRERRGERIHYRMSSDRSRLIRLP